MMRMNRAGAVLLLVVAILALGGVQARSQDVERDALADLSIEELMRIHVGVASLKQTSILDTPSMVSVIDDNLIEKYNIQSVAEAVNLVAGMSVLRTYLKRDLPTARGVLQDHYANKVLILINGIPTWMAVTGEGALQRIDIHDVARIEVLKGPASVLYGTNAYSGAINIVLKDPATSTSGMQLGVADGFGFRAGGHFVSHSDDFDLFLSANATNDIGQDYDFVDEGGHTGVVDQYVKTHNFTGRMTTDHDSVLVNAYTVDESTFGVTPNFSAGAGRDHLLEGVLANYTHTFKVGSSTTIDAGLTYDWNARDFARTADDSVRASIEGYRALVFGKAVVALSDHWNLEGGINLERRTSQEYRNYDPRTNQTLAANNMDGREVDERSAFAQVGYTADRFHVVLGSRFTDNELFGNDVSSRATVVYRLSSSSSLKLNAGQSYRVPSLFELYFQTPTNTVYGNTALTPETNDTIELAYLGTYGKLFFEALAYHAAYDNKIFRTRRYPDFVDDPSDTSTIYVNGATFEADGFEGTLRYQRSQGVSAFLNYAYTDGDSGDRIAGSDHYNFKYIPEHSAAAGVALRLDRFLMSGVVNYQSSVGAPVEPIDSQTTLDLNFGYRHKLGSTLIKHVISLKNVTDDEVEIPEYVRQRLNSVPSGYGRRISYTVSFEL